MTTDDSNDTPDDLPPEPSVTLAPMQTPLNIAVLTMENVQVFLARTVPHGWHEHFDALGRAVDGLNAELGELQREPVGIRSREPVDRDAARHAAQNQALSNHLNARQHHRQECQCRVCTYGGCRDGAPCGDCLRCERDAAVIAANKGAGR